MRRILLLTSLSLSLAGSLPSRIAPGPRPYCLDRVVAACPPSPMPRPAY